MHVLFIFLHVVVAVLPFFCHSFRIFLPYLLCIFSLRLSFMVHSLIFCFLSSISCRNFVFIVDFLDFSDQENSFNHVSCLRRGLPMRSCFITFLAAAWRCTPLTVNAHLEECFVFVWRIMKVVKLSFYCRTAVKIPAVNWISLGCKIEKKRRPIVCKLLWTGLA